MSKTGTITIDDFEHLYEQFGPMVLRRCRFLLKDEEKALDAMQDVFVRIIERREKLNGACSSLFYTVATSVCLNRIRSDKLRTGPGIDFILETAADNRNPDHEERIVSELFLGKLFSELPESTRYMAYLHYVDGLTLEQTAAQTGLSVSGVRKRLTGLRKKAQARERE